MKIQFASDVLSPDRLQEINNISLRKMLNCQVEWHYFNGLAHLDEYAISRNIIQPCLNVPAPVAASTFTYEGLVSCANGR